MKRFLFWGLLFVALFGGSYMIYHLVLPVRIAYHVFILAALAIYLYQHGFPHSPMTLAALAMFAALALSILGAMDPRMGFENGWNWFINLLAFLSFIQLFRENHGEILFRAQFVAGWLAAIGVLIEWWTTGGRPLGVFLNINLTGAFSAALLIPALNAARENQGLQRVAYAGLSVVLILSVMVGNNRGALLSAGIAMLVYVATTAGARRVVKMGIWLGGGVVLMSALVIMSLQPGHFLGDHERLDLWRAGGDMFSNHAFGVGPGLFAQAYREIGATGQNRYAGAHNAIINLGAELGAPGLAAGAVLLLVFIYCLIESDLQSRSQFAALAALIGILAHLMVDNFPSDNWAWLIAIYAAYVVYPAKLDFGITARQLLTALAVITLTIWTIKLLMFDRAQIPYEIGLNSRRYYDVYEAHLLDPDLKLYSLELERLSDPAHFPIHEDLTVYGLTMYGRRFE